MRRIDTFLNSITMYRLTAYGLCVLAIIAIIFGFTGTLPHGGAAYLYSLFILLIVCASINFAFAKLYNVPTNTESWLITGLILFFIVFPATTLADAGILVGAAFLAMASKYVVAVNKRHFFNPAAFAVLILGLLGSGNAVWWVGTASLLPFVLVLGLLIVRKIRKFPMFLSFLAATTIATLLARFFFSSHPADLQDLIMQTFLSWPVIFLGTIMLTEPLTMPPRKSAQVAYGALVGTVSSIPFNIGILYGTPELALLLGNIYAYAVSFKRRVMLFLKEKREIAKDIYELSFASDVKLQFMPGQYFEWTVSNDRGDGRGNRRYFTIASSPTESEIKIGIKKATPSSSFKTKLLSLRPEEEIVAGNLAGDFTLPADAARKLVFIAGGIGVTPFRSMIKYLLDTKDHRDIVFFYCVKSEQEIAYRDIFREAEQEINLKVHYLAGESVTEEMIKREVPAFESRVFYLSGPNAMVESYKRLLKKLNIKDENITTDYFPGF